jgi:hypothetical protein
MKYDVFYCTSYKVSMLVIVGYVRYVEHAVVRASRHTRRAQRYSEGNGKQSALKSARCER